jgi:hypothetical protein
LVAIRPDARAKCLTCRFRQALEGVGEGKVPNWDGYAAGLFDTGPARLSRKAWELTRRLGLDHLELEALLRQHARGDFGLVGRYDPAQDTHGARDLGPLADRGTRNTIAIANRRGDVLSARPVGAAETLFVWSILGRSHATIVFTADDDVEVY